MIFGHPESTLLPGNSTTSSLTPIPFSSFKFNTIGKEPDLLRRISAPNPDEEYDDDEPSRSSSSSPNLEDQLLLPDHPGSRSRPTLSQSLAERIGNFDVDMTDVTPITDQNQTNSSPTPSSNLQDPPNLSQTKVVGGQPKLSDPVHTVTAQPTDIDILAQPSTTLNHVPQLAPPITPSVSAVNDDVSLAVLRALHTRLSSALSLLNTPNTTNAILLAQSAKTTSAAVLSSAQRAHALSQQSINSAQEAVLAAQECLRAAQEGQERADAAMAAIKSLSSGRDDYEVFVSFKKDLNALDKWVNKREADEADHRTHTPRDESVSMVADEAVIPPRDRGKLRAVRPRAKSVVRPTVEEEANAAAIAWNQEREESVERRKFAEKELRKRRNVEAALEQERLRAQAEADAHEANLVKVRTERIEAEELEEARQANEAREIERRQREVEAMRKEAAMFAMQQQKAEDERVQQEQDAKRKAAEAEKENEARLLLEQEQKCKEIQEREERIKQNEAERVKAIGAEEVRQQILRQEQEMKRQEIQAQKHLATQQAALKIIAEREKQKLGQSTSASPPSEKQQKPFTLSAPPTNPTPKEFGNIVSKKTLISGSSSQVKSKANARVLSGGIMLGTEPEQRLTSPSCPPSALPTSSVNSYPTLASQSANGLNDVVQTPILQPSTQPLVSGPDNVEPAAELNNAPPLPVNTTKRSSTPRNALDSKDLGLKGSGNGSDRFNVPPIKHVSGQSPAPPFLSPTSSASLIQLKPAVISVHRQGSDLGNLPIVPPSRTGPISPEAQHTNLRFLDAQIDKSIPNASVKPIKMEPVPDHLPPPPKSVSTASPLEKIAPSQADAGPPRTQKVPFPFREHTQPRTMGSPTAPSSTSTSEPPRKNLPPLPVRPKQKLPNFKKNLVVNEPVANPMSSTNALPPSGPFKPVIVSAMVQPPRHHNSAPRPAVDLYDLSSTQMGPDVADSNGWTRPSRDDEVTIRSPVRDRQRRAMDHYPPPPDNIASSRVPPQRRVSDHYSPPSGNGYMQANRWDRPASPARGWARSLPPDASRGRGRSSPPPDAFGNWSPLHSPRGWDRTPQPSWDVLSGHVGGGMTPSWIRTPSPPLYNAPAPVPHADPPPLIGRKRVRDDEVPVAPPARRYRYEQDNPSREEYTLIPRAPQMPSTNENDWSRSAVYARSPSPGLRPGLASRLAPGPNEWESNVYAVGRGESYRPSYSATIHEAPKRPLIRRTKQRAQPPLQPAQLRDGDIPHAPAITNNTRPPKNQYRPPKEPEGGGSLPDLLSRFSDSTDPTVIQANPHPTKPARNRYNGKGRGGTPQSLEQRISSKPSSLMHRLEGERWA
ncbi:hypothetical protein K443DRAFT_671121 [Laccaria amethystina LaAM-08-1]|uniref:Uncharacterized protein n=1 Tax=Laccaria amethystina LaAM-08-1 TaxID=1095629 RepID=A0A0C9XXT0_9AGAR|nr:hypothetical protein K443DRAFT_671121 [Laccaria amethystina LaAM-08-1]